ncbi:MAG TPA: energy transducer TonB [Terriglobales bacterium]|nr:energy transducer TonB [Terriglobales bacterium]
MFADALLDSHHQTRRGWATLTSFGIQIIFIACLLIIPLLYTQVLPNWKSVTPVAMPRLGVASIQPVAQTQSVSGGQSIFSARRLDILLRPQIARLGGHSDNSDGPPEVSFRNEGNGDSASPYGVLNGIGNVAPQIIIPKHPQENDARRKSVMMEGSLIHRVEPIYPPIARSTRIQGNVLLAAVIGKDGTVQNLQVVNGHPMLVRAALEAVRQWRYRPYVLNGAPIEVDTQISVNFILAQ